MSTLNEVLNDAGPLKAVDGAVIVAVLVAGEVHHYGTAVLSDPAGMVDVLVAFLFGWYAAASLLGLYGVAADGPGRHSLRAVAVTAIAGANVGLIVRSLAFGRPQISPFPAVITVTLVVALVAVRWAVRRAARSEEASSLGAGEYQPQN